MEIGGQCKREGKGSKMRFQIGNAHLHSISLTLGILGSWGGATARQVGASRPCRDCRDHHCSCKGDSATGAPHSIPAVAGAAGAAGAAGGKCALQGKHWTGIHPADLRLDLRGRSTLSAILQPHTRQPVAQGHRRLSHPSRSFSSRFEGEPIQRLIVGALLSGPPSRRIRRGP